MRLTIAPARVPAEVDAIDVVVLAANGQGAQMLLQERAQLTPELASGYAAIGGRVARLDLSRAVFRPDMQANRDVYGAGATLRTIFASSELSAPTEALGFLTALNAPAASPRETAAESTGTVSTPAARGVATTGSGSTQPPPDDLRARVAALQRMLDGLLADARNAAGDTPAAAPGSVVVERSRLVQIRGQLDALLDALNRQKP